MRGTATFGLVAVAAFACALVFGSSATTQRCLGAVRALPALSNGQPSRVGDALGSLAVEWRVERERDRSIVEARAGAETWRWSCSHEDVPFVSPLSDAAKSLSPGRVP